MKIISSRMGCPMASHTHTHVHTCTHSIFQKKPAASNFYSEDAADTVLQNTGIYLPLTSQKTIFFKITTA